MDREELVGELNFVGNKKKMSWFNQSLAGDLWFINMINEILARKRTSLRNILYSLFPITEYLYVKRSRKNDSVFSSRGKWSEFVRKNLMEIVDMSVDFGTQGNIPQRAAIMLDYLNRFDLINNGRVVVIELGCSMGLVGRVFENSVKIFNKHGGRLADEYFWLRRRPMIKYDRAEYFYFGYEKRIPPPDLVPFFVLEKEKRAKVRNFLSRFIMRGLILEQPLESFFETNRLVSYSPIIIITSFLLYQFEDPELIIENIQRKVKPNIHWLDLSRNRGLPGLFADSANLRSDWIYLSHNGVPVAEIRDGSDDCPNWVYI